MRAPSDFHHRWRTHPDFARATNKTSWEVVCFATDWQTQWKGDTQSPVRRPPSYWKFRFVREIQCVVLSIWTSASDSLTHVGIYTITMTRVGAMEQLLSSHIRRWLVVPRNLTGGALYCSPPKLTLPTTSLVKEFNVFNKAFPDPVSCFTNVSWTLQNILSKFVYRRNRNSYENFKLKLCMCIQIHALGTHTKFRLEILTLNVIYTVANFREIILESSRNVSETTPWLPMTQLFKARGLNCPPARSGRLQKL